MCSTDPSLYTTAPIPPGPGFPLHDPSVYTSCCILFIVYSTCVVDFIFVLGIYVLTMYTDHMVRRQ